MIIQCPACGQQAKLPDSKEGAKVRCSDCERVYVAKSLVGSARSSSRGSDPTKMFLYGGAVLVFAIVMIMVNKTEPPPAKPPEKEPEKTVYVDSAGWDGPLVVFARKAHEMSADPKTEAGLLGVLDAEKIWARHNTPAAEDEAEREVDTRIWSLVTKNEISVFMANELESILRGEGDRPVSTWEPYDGWLVESSDDEAIVRLKVSDRLSDRNLPDRHIEWRLIKRKGKWRAWYYDRWFSPAELEGQKRARTKKTTRKTLSDGSLVIEGVMRPIPYMDETPPDLRDRIEKLIDNLIDLEARPRVRTEAEQELVVIGKPAIPGLLTRLNDIPFTGEENAMKLNKVHMLLGDMTGYITSFKVAEVMGGTQERSESGLKQWFGWYDRKWKRFTGPPEPEDPFAGWELTDKEKREIKRDERNERLNSGGND
jgi:hypothetical protein